MSARARRRLFLPFVLGFSDGILNALILAAGRIVDGRRADLGVGLRVAVASLVTAVFTVYVAHYADLRSQLARASHQLSLASRGHLATTRLGRRSLREAVDAGIVAGATSFAGAFVPLLAGAVLPGPSWLPLVISLALQALLGAGIGVAVAGSPLLWSCALLVGGACVALVGLRLHIV